MIAPAGAGCQPRPRVRSIRDQSWSVQATRAWNALAGEPRNVTNISSREGAIVARTGDGFTSVLIVQSAGFSQLLRT